MSKVRNGRIPTSQLVALPTRWSNQGRDEYLIPSAYASFSRMIARAVADTGVNFQLWDAYRDYDEQVEWLKEYYEPARSGRHYNSYRIFQGKRWGQKPGKPKAAQPGRSNHGLGISVDIHPGAIHTWMKRNAARFGWVNDVPSEPWHWSYKYPARDRYRSEGVLDHAAVQKAVGAEVDGKIGTGTVAKIKERQKELGLTADGKVGPITKKALGLSGKAAEAPSPSPSTSPSTSVDEVKEPDAVLTPSKDGGFTYTYLRDEWDTQGIAEDVHPYDAPVKGIYLHWPGSQAKFYGLSPEEVAVVLRGYRRDHQVGKGWRDFGYGAAVDWAGRTYQGRGLDMEVGSNGGSVSNSEAGSILFLMGTRETPTPEMIAGANGLLAQYAKKYGEGYLRGHRESPDASTTCPGKRIMNLIEDGSLNWSGKAKVVSGDKIKEAGAGHVVEDGRFGHDTVTAFMEYLLEHHPKTTDLGKAGVDGKAGHNFWRSLQGALGTPVDGEVWNQSYEAEELGNGITQGWKFTGRGSKGSKMVRALQKELGIEADGVWFEGTTSALQKALNSGKKFL